MGVSLISVSFSASTETMGCLLWNASEILPGSLLVMLKGCDSRYQGMTPMNVNGLSGCMGKSSKDGEGCVCHNELHRSFYTLTVCYKSGG